eukprot:m.23196 g.23196  ORF g.23196 m.23196 type:complete len:581 (-) comp7471_c0_seq1:171-1913(-)
MSLIHTSHFTTRVPRLRCLAYRVRVEQCVSRKNEIRSFSSVGRYSLFPNTYRPIAEIPSLPEFLAQQAQNNNERGIPDAENVPYIKEEDLLGRGRRVYMETYGCQMNVNDTEIAWGILNNAGYEKSQTVDDADIALLMTCAIREGAERKVFTRVSQLNALKTRKDPSHRKANLKIGILGCMAERLKEKLLEDVRGVDLVAGPDAYRDLPRMLANTQEGQAQINVQLSLDETYGDVAPVRLDAAKPNVFISIMRGCNNMCSYCIVPFTRGRERSRDIASILKEVEYASKLGYKEVTLLGQNVNSYCFGAGTSIANIGDSSNLSRGFSTLYKRKEGGVRFAELINEVSLVNPNMRIRFTSPHPKDFPDALLDVMNNRPNVCKNIHLPAQSGSTRVLASMRRGYSKESYLDLVEHIRQKIPGVTLSSDFIAGFCGETEKDHEDTLDLLQRVRFDQAFLFAYSMRQKTHAHRRLVDDVDEETKKRRLKELIEVFHKGAAEANAERSGQQAVVLVENSSKRSDGEWVGRTDGNTKVVFPKGSLPDERDTERGQVSVKVGDYVRVQLEGGGAMTMRGVPQAIVSLQ